MSVNDSVEIQAIQQFLRSCVLFSQFDDDILADTARAIRITYHCRNDSTDLFDQTEPQLFIVRSGAVELRSDSGDLLDRIDAGGYFANPKLLATESRISKAVALEDSLLYQIDEKTFQRLCLKHEFFNRLINQPSPTHIPIVKDLSPADDHWSGMVAELMSSELVLTPSTTTVASAAQMMTSQRVSSLLIVDNEELVGILTDRDLRSRVVAENLAGNTEVSHVMTPNPVTIANDALLFEALLTMANHNIHHLPVVEVKKPVGLLNTTDVIKKIHSEPVYLINEIYRQPDIEGLRQTATKIPHLLANLIARDARADEIGHVVTTVTDAITRQLIKHCIARNGEPPVPFVWLAFGSQGRQEQSARSDQDNGLLFDNACDEQGCEYFRNMADYVCAGLDACGYQYCPGNVMAVNEKWRMTLGQWQDCFRAWIEQPEPKALMHASIFFDMRAIYGSDTLFHQLQKSVLKLSRDNSIFLACLTQNALLNRSPLGLFRQFVVERNGEHKNTFDMKLTGIMPITDIARIYALAIGSEEVNTLKRFASLSQSEWMTPSDSNNLADAYEFLSHLRLLHQGRQLQARAQVDNHISPTEISGLTRAQLKNAFAVINTAQAALKMKFTGHYF